MTRASDQPARSSSRLSTVGSFSIFTFASALAFSSLVFGAVGMSLSLAFLSMKPIEDVVSGAAGFIAGAVLLGAGTVSFAVLAGSRERAR